MTVTIAVVFLALGYLAGRFTRDLKHAEQIIGYETVITRLTIERNGYVAALDANGVEHPSPFPRVPSPRAEMRHVDEEL